MATSGFDDSSFERSCTEAWAENHLHLIVMPTEKCNFRCIYCYEDFSIGRMKRPVIDGLKALLRRRAPSLSSLEIQWFGGEPTLASEIVCEVMADTQKVARTHGISLRGGMTTNGFLLNAETYRRFYSCGISHYQITLDGPPELHDTTRLQANGHGSFDTIWSNLLAIKQVKAGGDILLRIHLTKRNVALIPEFIERIKQAFGDDPRFRFNLQRVENLGGPNDISELVVAASVHSWGHRAGLPSEHEDRMEKKDGDEYVCYAAKANSYVIRADGRVGKCTVALKSDANCIGRILQDGTMEIDAKKLAPWLTGWKTQQKEALACPAAVVFV
jgi:uncharacterized protein